VQLGHKLVITIANFMNGLHNSWATSWSWPISILSIDAKWGLAMGDSLSLP